MVNIDLKLKDEIDTLRESLYSLLSSENCKRGDVLEASQQLDEIIVRYLRTKSSICKSK